MAFADVDAVPYRPGDVLLHQRNGIQNRAAAREVRGQRGRERATCAVRMPTFHALRAEFRETGPVVDDVHDLRGVGVDQHLLARRRQEDMLQVIDAHPELLGIGLDEGTAIVVRGDVAEVVGVSKMAVYDKKYGGGPDGKRYYFLSAGDKFDLAGRKRM